MRAVLLGVVLLAGTPAWANCVVCPEDIRAYDQRKQAERDRRDREFENDYNNYLADNRARETNRRLQAIQREIEATRDELRWQQRLDPTFDRPRY